MFPGEFFVRTYFDSGYFPEAGPITLGNPVRRFILLAASAARYVLKS